MLPKARAGVSGLWRAAIVLWRVRFGAGECGAMRDARPPKNEPGREAHPPPDRREPAAQDGRMAESGLPSSDQPARRRTNLSRRRSASCKRVRMSRLSGARGRLAPSARGRFQSGALIESSARSVPFLGLGRRNRSSSHRPGGREGPPGTALPAALRAAAGAGSAGGGARRASR